MNRLTYALLPRHCLWKTTIIIIMAIIISKTKLQWDCHKSVDNYSIVNCVTTEIMGYQSRFTHIYPHNNNIQKLHCSYNNSYSSLTLRIHHLHRSRTFFIHWRFCAIMNTWKIKNAWTSSIKGLSDMHSSMPVAMAPYKLLLYPHHWPS